MSIRKEQILNAALSCARTSGAAEFTRARIGELAGVAPSLISYYLGDLASIYTATMEAAVERRDAGAVAHGLRTGHPVALAAPESLKKQAAKFLISQ